MPQGGIRLRGGVARIKVADSVSTATSLDLGEPTSSFRVIVVSVNGYGFAVLFPGRSDEAAVRLSNNNPVNVTASGTTISLSGQYRIIAACFR